ncbi:MAG TPA: hypothetical protein VJ740_06210 [Hyphomicrobiaceae bacterium]|nr:hypothetical protein [Hyphomicrobiaceae bacterium]
MRSWVLAASLLAAAVSSGAQAADLDEGPPPDRYGSAYDDPRYADIYKYPRPPAYVPAPPPPYAAAPLPRERVYRDDDGPDYDHSPRRYSYTEPVPPYASGCTPRALVKERLFRQGWRDFHDADLRGGLATVRARRPSGRLFELTLDRCSGDIVRAEPLEGRPWGPFAYGPPPRRWDRFY